jgi:hypothetical protein
LAKRERKNFLSNGLGTLWVRQLGNHLKTFPGKKHVSIQPILLQDMMHALSKVNANKCNPLKRSRSIGIKKGGQYIKLIWGEWNLYYNPQLGKQSSHFLVPILQLRTKNPQREKRRNWAIMCPPKSKRNYTMKWDHFWHHFFLFAWYFPFSSCYMFRYLMRGRRKGWKMMWVSAINNTS